MKPHKAYIAAKRAFLAGKRCARCGGGGLIDPHHWAGCAGPLKMDFRLILPLCRKCHDWAHHNQNAAREDGWLCPKGCWNDQKRALKAWGAASKVDV